MVKQEMAYYRWIKQPKGQCQASLIETRSVRDTISKPNVENDRRHSNVNVWLYTHALMHTHSMVSIHK